MRSIFRKGEQMKTKVVLLSLALLPLLIAGPMSRVRADIVDCTTISSLPFVITTPGKYCLSGDLSFNLGNVMATAISIQADDVIVDLNGHTMSSTGSRQTAFDTVLPQQRITIRNGTLRGFASGTYLSLTASTIENMRVVGNSAFGIQIFGSSNI